MADEQVAGLDPIFKSEGVALRARQAIEEANNSLYGSQSFFLSKDGGEPDKYHLSRPIEELKQRAGRLWRENQELRAEITRLTNGSEVSHHG